MEYASEVRRMILSTIVRFVPKGFWVDLAEGARWLYEESLDANLNDDRIRPSQVRAKTIDDRFYFMEGVLARAAEEYGLSAGPETIPTNQWKFTLIRAGGLNFTAKYVHGAGDMASPARFREQLAGANEFVRQLSWLDEQAAASERPINGIIIHGPLSRDDKHPEFRQLGFLHFAVPWKDFSGWAVNVPVLELLSAYEHRIERTTDPAPQWKKRDETKDDKREGGDHQ